MSHPYGWDYPAGLENNPNAPWNQIDNGEDSEDDHAAMLSCKCSKSDRLLAWCLWCGKSSFDPSWAILALAVAFVAAQAVRWAW